MNCGKICLIALVLFSGLKAYSQAISSPYSGDGIGEMSFQGLPQNYMMGEVGIGTPNAFHINLQNPSMLPYNSLSSFQVGVEIDNRTFSTDDASASKTGMSLRYLAMSFPVVSQGRWVSSVALLPLSSVNYRTVSFSEVLGPDYQQEQKVGQGGLSQLTWGNGFRVYKTLSVGFKASYVFGDISDQTLISLLDDATGAYSSAYVTSYEERTSYSDIMISGGVSYRAKIGEKKFLNFGVVYQPSTVFSGEVTTKTELKTLSNITVREYGIDTLSQDFSLPTNFGLGLSYEYLAKLKVGVDFSQALWGQNATERAGEDFRNVFTLGVGAEWIPDNQSVSSYWNRVAYRVGFNMKQIPYRVNDTDINDFGINFGMSMPVSTASSFDLGFKVGVRGTASDNLIRENYFQVMLAATINDRWFIKRRYD